MRDRKPWRGGAWGGTHRRGLSPQTLHPDRQLPHLLAAGPSGLIRKNSTDKGGGRGLRRLTSGCPAGLGWNRTRCHTGGEWPCALAQSPPFPSRAPDLPRSTPASAALGKGVRDQGGPRPHAPECSGGRWGWEGLRLMALLGEFPSHRRLHSKRGAHIQPTGYGLSQPGEPARDLPFGPGTVCTRVCYRPVLSSQPGARGAAPVRKARTRSSARGCPCVRSLWGG